MKWPFLSFSLLALICCFNLMMGCQNNRPQSDSSNNTAPAPAELINEKLSVADFEQLLKSKADAQLLDVRTAEELKIGMIEGALHYDFHQEDFREKLKKLDPQKPVFVYCRSGGRSGSTAIILEELGFWEIYDLQGGYLEWSSKH